MQRPSLLQASCVCRSLSAGLSAPAPALSKTHALTSRCRQPQAPNTHPAGLALTNTQHPRPLPPPAPQEAPPPAPLPAGLTPRQYPSPSPHKGGPHRTAPAGCPCWLAPLVWSGPGGQHTAQLCQPAAPAPQQHPHWQGCQTPARHRQPAHRCMMTHRREQKSCQPGRAGQDRTLAAELPACSHICGCRPLVRSWLLCCVALCGVVLCSAAPCFDSNCAE